MRTFLLVCPLIAIRFKAFRNNEQITNGEAKGEELRNVIVYVELQLKEEWNKLEIGLSWGRFFCFACLQLDLKHFEL